MEVVSSHRSIFASSQGDDSSMLTFTSQRSLFCFVKVTNQQGHLGKLGKRVVDHKEWAALAALSVQFYFREIILSCQVKKKIVFSFIQQGKIYQEQETCEAPHTMDDLVLFEDVQTSFPITHEVDNVGIFVQLLM